MVHKPPQPEGEALPQIPAYCGLSSPVWLVLVVIYCKQGILLENMKVVYTVNKGMLLETKVVYTVNKACY